MPNYATRDLGTLLDCLVDMLMRTKNEKLIDEHKYQLDSLISGLFFLGKQGRYIWAHLVESILHAHNQFFKFKSFRE